MNYLFSKWTSHEIGIPSAGILLIDIILVAALLYCAYTDHTRGKIYNKITFPLMALGLILNGVFGGWQGLGWAFMGWCVGMGIQWVPYMLGFAKAGDVKLLAAVGAMKGWAFCSFGFLYGAAAFGLLWLPKLARGGELKLVGNNLKGYFAAAAVTQQVPDAPEPVVKRYAPWGVGLVIGFLIALILERVTGRPNWMQFS